MLNIKVAFDDITISNIQKEDILTLHNWINLQSFYMKNKRDNSMELKELYERFLECYISENEFFLKIYREDKLIGVLKGRLEFKNDAEAWIWCFFLGKDVRNKGIGSKALQEFMTYVKNEYGVKYFYSTIMGKRYNGMSFWKNNGYEVLRISKNYYNIDGKDIDMIILKKKDRVI
ncbi:GNAT family N-acetyltransferase [Clostridium lundense]|uniref:GNAT family N-acetyltransferase n=1 Tax=Clostridium lundense TaxID=319475 RepID=UPI00047FD5B3|nr:GNAT family N-acetyltransferase [Clostridium lundense]